MRWSKCSWYSKPYDASCHKCQRGRLVERCLVSGRRICVWLPGKGCLCMITAQAGQGMSVYDYCTSWSRDVCVWLPDELGKGCLCIISGRGMCMYVYWTSWTREVCIRLPGKGRLCMITGQAGQGMSVIIGNGISVYDKWAWDFCERKQ
jgi:hypothetical protein